MKKIKFILVALLCMLFEISYAQKFTISGTIKDKSNGEAIIGAVIQVKEIPGLGVVTNEYGFYSLSVPSGEYNFVTSFIGYSEQTKSINLNQNITQNWELGEDEALEVVEVTAEKKNDNLTKSEIGTETLNIKEISKVPVLFGEKDILKTIQLLPGIKSTGKEIVVLVCVAVLLTKI